MNMKLKDQTKVYEEYVIVSGRNGDYHKLLEALEVFYDSQCQSEKW